MLEEETGVGAVATMVVTAVRAMDVLPFVLGKQVAVSRTQDMLLADVHAHGCLAEEPCGVSVKRGAVDVGAMIVLTVLGSLLAACELIVVDIAVPVSLRRDDEALVAEGLDVSLCGSDDAARCLPLIIKLGAVERGSAIVLRRKSGLPDEVSVS